MQESKQLPLIDVRTKMSAAFQSSPRRINSDGLLPFGLPDTEDAPSGVVGELEDILYAFETGPGERIQQRLGDDAIRDQEDDDERQEVDEFDEHLRNHRHFGSETATACEHLEETNEEGNVYKAREQRVNRLALRDLLKLVGF